MQVLLILDIVRLHPLCLMYAMPEQYMTVRAWALNVSSPHTTFTDKANNLQTKFCGIDFVLTKLIDRHFVSLSSTLANTNIE